MIARYSSRRSPLRGFVGEQGRVGAIAPPVDPSRLMSCPIRPRRFGARTAMAPLLIGAVFLLLGVLLEDSGFPLLALVPSAVLGGLLFFSGVELAISTNPRRYNKGGASS